MAAVRLLVSTRKGLFTLLSDAARTRWQLLEPALLGHVIQHTVADLRGSGTVLCSAKTGHLGPTIFRSTDDGATWKEAERPPAFDKASGDEVTALMTGKITIDEFQKTICKATAGAFE